MAADKNIGFRTTWAEIDLSALEFNFLKVKGLVGKKIKIMAVIKSDAYGHGLLPVAKRLAKLGVDYLAVSGIDEAVILRKNRIKLPILIMGNILSRDIDAVIEHRLTQTISDYQLAYALNQKAKAKDRVVAVHIKVDTGMGRLGILYREAKEFVKSLRHFHNLKIEGLFTHFPSADCDPEFTNYQIDIFNQLIRELSESGLRIPLLHAANSMGIIKYPNSYFSLVRPGLMLYGLYPKQGLGIRLKPVLSLKSRVVYLKRMHPGQGISYGRSYITKKQTTIAILPIGYSNGYPRNLSNRSDVLIKGRRFRITGAVCMDQIIVDVGDSKIKIGDEVVLIGRQGKLDISAEELASICQTIPYEIVCGINSKVARLYIN